MALLLFGDHAADARIRASGQIDTLPAVHVRHPVVAKRWQCPGTAGWIELDAGAPVPVRGLVAAGCHIGPADTIRWRLSLGHAAAGDVLDTGPVPATGVELDGYAAWLLPATVTARHLRVDVDAPSRTAKGWFGLGRLFWADGWQPTAGAEYGARERPIDPSVIDRAPVSGAEYIVRRPSYREITLTFGALDAAADRAVIRRLRRTVGATGQVVLIPDPDSPTVVEELILGRLEEPPGLRFADHGLDQATITVRESR